MVVLSKKGTTWYKTFGALKEVLEWFGRVNPKHKRENFILIELPSYKEIDLDKLEELV